MKTKQKAIAIFNRIGDGHKFAVKRPWDLSVDRSLIAMIEYANSNGDCIIPRENGEGYYRPIPSDPVDASEYKSYMLKEHTKIRTMQLKELSMQIAYEARGIAYEL